MSVEVGAGGGRRNYFQGIPGIEVLRELPLWLGPPQAGRVSTDKRFEKVQQTGKNPKDVQVYTYGVCLYAQRFCTSFENEQVRVTTLGSLPLQQPSPILLGLGLCRNYSWTVGLHTCYASHLGAARAWRATLRRVVQLYA